MKKYTYPNALLKNWTFTLSVYKRQEMKMKKGIQLNPVLDRITLKQVNRILSVIFIISLAPLLILAFFDHPAIDDFVFGAQIHHTIQAGGSIFDTVRVAVEQTAQVYQEWQRSFAAVFLFSFQPAVWGESFYWITPYIMLGIYVISTFFFGKVLCVDLLKASKAQWCLLSVLIMGISIQTMPSPVQGIYWYNGAVYYTFFYSLSLLLWGWILQEHLKHPSFLRKGIILVFCVLIGGGNYITALLSVLLLFIWLAVHIYRKLPGRWFIFVALVVLAGAFVVSIIAPGNLVRAQSYEKQSILMTILDSFYYGSYFIREWSEPLFWGVSIAMALVFWKMAGKTTYHFRYPLLVSVGIFCLYCAQFSPALYGMGSYGEGRILNIIYFSFWLLWAAQLFYWCGWLRRKINHYCATHRENQCGMRKGFRKSKPYMIAFCTLIVVAGCGIRMAKDDPADFHGLISLEAAYSLVSGEAASYDQEYQNRLELLEDPAIRQAKLTPYTKRPYLLYYGDLTQKIDYPWSNRAMARYYKKESVWADWKTYHQIFPD